jgi:RNA recognition motif-containing protein
MKQRKPLAANEKQLILSEVKFSHKCSSQKGGSMNIYVGNLSGEIGDDDLREAFEAFGQVASVAVIKDKFSGESRGFGFVEMPSKDEAKSAIEGLNGKDLKGQSLNVNEARPRNESRGGRGGYGGSRGGQGGGKGGHGGSKGGYGGGKGKYGGGGGGRRGNR